MHQQKIDIGCFNEIKLENHKPYKIINYKTLMNGRTNRGGGVSINPACHLEIKHFGVDTIDNVEMAFIDIPAVAAKRL